ncbi:MAG: hypothetical protein JW928_06705 [Candidatus Aureabacteria bacterium]|nr:hypothetical protein [Candidatus Auribacterota bacterium]
MNEQKEFLDFDFKYYLQVIKNKIWLIVSVFFLIAILGAVFAFLLPRKYEVTQLFSLPAGYYNEYLDSARDIERKISGDYYNQAIIKELDILNSQKINLRIIKQKRNDAIRVSLFVPDDEIETAIKIMNSLIRQLEKDYAKDITIRKQDFQNEIMKRRYKIKGLEEERVQIKNKISLQEKQVEDNNLRIEFLEKILYSYQKKLGISEQGEKSMFLDNSSIPMEELYYYFSIEKKVQDLKAQNMNFHEINRSLNARERKEIPAEIEINKSEIKNIILKKSYIKNVRQIHKPYASEAPVKPDRKKIIVMSVFIGAFISLFFAFLSEFIKTEVV